jgi:hypothetical protein
MGGAEAGRREDDEASPWPFWGPLPGEADWDRLMSQVHDHGWDPPVAGEPEWETLMRQVDAWYTDWSEGGATVY